MRPTIGNSIAALRSTPHRPQMEILNRQRARIRSMFFIVAFATLLVALVIYVVKQRLNGVGESEREFSASAALSDSVVRENSTLSLQVGTYSLPTDASIQDVQMINAMDGWVWGYGTELYKTSDGGEHWTPVPLNLPARSYITDAYFLNQDAGWIAVSKTEHDSDDDATWIFETRDGGKTLTERSGIKHGQITEIEFVDGREGWATGRMLSRGYPERDANLVLHTSSGGKDWQNRAAKLPADTGVGALHLIGARQAAVLTDDGSVNKTVNEGESWTQVNKLNYKNDQVSIWGFELVLSRYPQSTFLTALAKTDQNDVMAVGFQGLVLKIKLPSPLRRALGGLQDGVLSHG